MTPPDSPSALLERAADLIETRAEEASAPPWRQYAFAGEPIVLSVPDLVDRKTWRTVVPDGVAPGNVEWIRTLGPQVAQPLVEWLRHAALAYRMNADSSQDERALTFARRVLGES